jgi:hypothetical protein
MFGCSYLSVDIFVRGCFCAVGFCCPEVFPVVLRLVGFPAVFPRRLKSLLVHHFSAVPSKSSDAWLDVCARAPVPSQRQRLLVAYDSVAASTSLPVYKWREPGETLQTPLESRVEEVV